MNFRKKKTILGLVCAAIALLALFAEKIPFYVYDEEVLHTTVKEFFSLEHLIRLMPLIIIIGAAVLIIMACIRLREKNMPGRMPGRINLRKAQTPGFMRARWIIMIVFAVVVMFGGIFSGVIIGGISFPVLACPTNRDQLIESSCYFLAHLPELFESYTASAILLFFVSTIGFALFFGRIICGFLCPMGLIQDTVHLIRQKLGHEGVTMTDKRYQLLTPVKWLMILLMFGLVFAGGDFCSFCPALATSPVLAGMKVSLHLSGFMMIIVLVGSFFKRRFWCNICPLGYLIGLGHKISPFRVKKDTTACTECGACYEACPMGIKMIYTEREKADVTDANCIMCGECVRRCPEDEALSICFAGKKLYTASRMKLLSGHEVKENG